MAAQLRELVQELAPHHAELNEQREQGAGTRAVRWIASKVGLADNTAQRESDRLWAQISPLQDQMRQRMESLAMGLRPGAGSDMRNEIQASLLRERSLTTALGAARAVLEAAIEAHKLCETAQTWESLDVASTFRQGHVTSTWLSSEATRDSQQAIAKLASALNALAQTGVQLPPTLVGIGEAGLRLNPRGDLYDLALPGAGMRDSFRNSDLEGNVAENIRVAWPELQAITAQLRQDRKSTQQHALEAIRQHVAGVDPAAGKAVADAIDAIETEPEAYLPTYGSAGPR